jgi:hypothetical protein
MDSGFSSAFFRSFLKKPMARPSRKCSDAARITTMAGKDNRKLDAASVPIKGLDF